MHQGSPFLPIFQFTLSLHGHRFTATGHLHTCTPSIQPNLDPPRTRPPLTSDFNTQLTRRYSYILSMYPNHLNALCSTVPDNSLSIPALPTTIRAHHFQPFPTHLSIHLSHQATGTSVTKSLTDFQVFQHLQ